jgi:hypothetical protein
MLAGKFYSYNAGFMRHPECDCAHQPCTKKASAAYVTDPYDYFRSLSPVEQDRLWGRYGAQAIRDGADMFSVGNAWRGMPRNARGAARLTTAEGVSPRKFGAYSGFFSRRYPGEQRLTPQGIYMTAKSPEEAIRLLRTHEYLVGPQDMHGVIGWADKGGTAKQIRRGDYVTTAAEERVDRARTKLESLLRKAQNPDTVTPPLETIARAETEYRRWLLSDGQIFTK